MRFTTVLSFLLAILLAGAAVLGAQQWLASERAQIAQEIEAQKVAAAQAVEIDVAPKPTVIIATRSISFGERITEAKVRQIEWGGDIVPEGSFESIAELIIGEDDVTARFAKVSIIAGEPILRGKVTSPGQRAKMSTVLAPGKKAVSIRVNDVSGVAGFVLPGDRVDVFLTRETVEQSFTDMLLQGVRVLAIDQIADDRKDKPSVVRTVTFEVDTQDAAKLIQGGTVGILSMALRNSGSDDVLAGGMRVTTSDLGSEVQAREAAVAVAASDTAPPAPTELTTSIEETLAQISNDLPRDYEFGDRFSDKPSSVEKNKVARQAAPGVIDLPQVIEGPRNAMVGVIRNGRRDVYEVLEVEQPGAQSDESDAAAAIAESGQSN